MMRVTISGADDSVDPSELALISDRYPFVEWAVLLSRKREGSARYPSAVWREHFYRELIESKDGQGFNTINSALHLCGEVAREAMAGDYRRMRNEFWLVDRWQINTPVTEGNRLLRLFDRGRCPPLILQCRDAESFSAYCLHAKTHEHRRTAVLYDPSGGTGAARPWPDMLQSYGVPFGIAGGIGPKNVRDAIAAADRLGASWIDMESGVRDEADRFDVKRVCEVLKRANGEPSP